MLAATPSSRLDGAGREVGGSNVAGSRQDARRVDSQPLALIGSPCLINVKRMCY